MKVIVRDIVLDSHTEAFSLYGFGDWHLGHLGFEEDVFEETLEIMEQDEQQKFYVLMGDYANCFPKQDKRKDKRVIDYRYADSLTAYTKIRDILKPLAENILVVLEGNHDNMWHRAEDQDYVSWLCTELQTTFAPFIKDERYGTYEAVVRFKVKRKNNRAKRNIDVVCWHGMGAPRTKGGKINVLTAPSLVFPFAHIFLMGHLHSHGVVLDDIFRLDEKNKDVIATDRYFAFTGAYLEGFPKDISTYVSRKMFPPLGIGALKMNITPFYGRHDKLHVTWEKIP